MNTRFRLLLAVLLISCSMAAAADSSPAGQWRAEFATPLGQRGVNMTIAQAGTKLTGHVIDEYGEYDLKGRFTGGRITVAWAVPEHGKMLEITMTGTLEGNVINGTARLGDVGEGAFSARRTGD